MKWHNIYVQNHSTVGVLWLRASSRVFGEVSADVGAFKTSSATQPTAQRHTSDDLNPQLHRCDSLRPG
jgi:hypothetical protein